jgi:[ribosomal protein S18]-alanine N-acetyltransferase
MATKPCVKIDEIRWMVRSDMPEVLAIDEACFEFPWREDDFIRVLRQRNNIGMVAIVKGCVVAYMLYELHRNRLHVLNFAVHPNVQRRGVGTALVNKLISKLSLQRRNRIMLEVRETNVDAQLFFRSHGFRAVSLLKDFYEDTAEDAYLMQYRYTADKEAALQEKEIAR